MSVSKNSSVGKKVKMEGKFVLSNDCEKCKSQCAKGLKYLELMSIKHEGSGVYCKK